MARRSLALTEEKPRTGNSISRVEIFTKMVSKMVFNFGTPKARIQVYNSDYGAFPVRVRRVYLALSATIMCSLT